MNSEELPRYTYADYLAWQGRWEPIDGVPFAMTPGPSVAHQQLSQRLAYLLEEALRDCAQCQALLPVDWKIDDTTVVQPDNLVVCYQPEEKYITRAPSLIFEILSRATAYKDIHTKFRLYRTEGVACYCLVFADERLVKVFDLKDGRYVKRLDASEESLKIRLGPCMIGIDLSRLWNRRAP